MQKDRVCLSTSHVHIGESLKTKHRTCPQGDRDHVLTYVTVKPIRSVHILPHRLKPQLTEKRFEAEGRTGLPTSRHPIFYPSLRVSLRLDSLLASSFTPNPMRRPRWGRRTGTRRLGVVERVISRANKCRKS